MLRHNGETGGSICTVYSTYFYIIIIDIHLGHKKKIRKPGALGVTSGFHRVSTV